MIKINFDKRIELIFGLLYCAYKDGYVNEDYGKYFFLKSDSDYYKKFYKLYKANITDEFLSYIKNYGFDTYNRTIEIALSLNDNYCIEEDNYIKKIEKNNSNFNKEKLQNLLKGFVVKSNYEEFYNSNKEYYKFLIEKFSKSLNHYKEYDSKILSDFYGYSMGKNEIKLFNFVNGSFGYNKKDLVISLNSINDEKEVSNKVINTCIHEFSHSYVNPLGYKYLKNVNIDNLFNEAKSHGLQNCYYDKYSFINEYVVRAIQVYFSEKFMEPDYVLRNIKYHQNIGYIYIEQIKNLFYKKDEYENFELFYKNEIVKYFKNLNDNNIDRIFINKKKR